MCVVGVCIRLWCQPRTNVNNRLYTEKENITRISETNNTITFITDAFLSSVTTTALPLITPWHIGIPVVQNKFETLFFL